MKAYYVTFSNRLPLIVTEENYQKIQQFYTNVDTATEGHFLTATELETKIRKAVEMAREGSTDDGTWAGVHYTHIRDEIVSAVMDDNKGGG